MCKKYIVMLVLFLCASVVQAELEHITLQQLSALMEQGVTVIDIRTPCLLYTSPSPRDRG